MEIIKLDHITKQYDDGFVALKDINLELESGKFYSLLGPSGSGKTTILRIIAGFTEASAGKVYFDGQDILTPQNVISIRFFRITLFFRT